jgi:branched-chain amino acid transport system ATP-binding protein
MTTEPALRTQELTKRFGGLTAVDRLSFVLPGGRAHAIIGPNGAGKTTFFNLVSGLLAPDSGRVFFHGRDITGHPPHAISRLGIKRTLQIKSVFPQLSVSDNLWITAYGDRAFLQPLRPASKDVATRRKVEGTLDQIGLAAHAQRQAGTLSYGDIALLEIGMALISQPRLLLLDEPTCGMSPSETERTVAKIRELARMVDIIIIEHDMEVVFEIAEHITVMAQGAVLASGTPQEIAANERVREAYLGREEDEDYVEETADAQA